MYISTDAIILKNTNYKESSIISRIFTYDYGKISVIFKGAKRGKSNVSGLIEPGNIVHITYYNNKSNIKTVKEVSLKKIYFKTRDIIDHYYYSMAVVSLLDKLSIEGNPEQQLFELTLKIFNEINEQNINNEILFLFFLMQLNKILGFELADSQSVNIPSFLNELNNQEASLLDIYNDINAKKDLINKAKIAIYNHMRLHLIDLNDVHALKMIKYLNNETTTRSD